jgi:hypothetical protein
LEGLAIEDVGIFYGHWVNFPAIWHILYPFGICSLVLVHFTHFGMLYQEKSGNPGQELNGSGRYVCHQEYIDSEESMLRQYRD